MSCPQIIIASDSVSDNHWPTHHEMAVKSPTAEGKSPTSFNHTLQTVTGISKGSKHSKSSKDSKIRKDQQRTDETLQSPINPCRRINTASNHSRRYKTSSSLPTQAAGGECSRPRISGWNSIGVVEETLSLLCKAQDGWRGQDPDVILPSPSLKPQATHRRTSL